MYDFVTKAYNKIIHEIVMVATVTDECLSEFGIFLLSGVCGTCGC